MQKLRIKHDTHVVIVVMLHVMFIAVQFMIQRRVYVQRCGGHRVHRDRDCRQNFVFGGSYVSVEIAVIAV